MNFNPMPNLDMVLARSWDQLFALHSPHTGKAAVVTVGHVYRDIIAADVPQIYLLGIDRDEDMICDAAFIVISDSTGDYDATCLVSPHFNLPACGWAFIFTDKEGK